MDGWAELEREIGTALAGLVDDEFLTLVAPAPAVIGRRWWQRRGPVAPYVQFLRYGDVLLGECCSGVTAGDTDAVLDAGLRAMGWRLPDDRTVAGIPNRHNYHRQWPDTPDVSRPVGSYPPAGAPGHAAGFAVAALRGPLGLASPKQVTRARGLP